MKRYYFILINCLLAQALFCSEQNIRSIETEKDFDQLMQNNTQPLAVQFHSGCPVCNSTRCHLKKIAPEYLGVRFIEVDINFLPQLAQRYSITALPTILIFEAGSREPKHTIVGPNNNEILKLRINEVVASSKKVTVSAQS